MKYKIATRYPTSNFTLTSISNKITDLGEDFLKFTGYSRNEVVNKDLTEVFVNLLKLPRDIFGHIDSQSKTECFIFTKSLQAREVIISTSKGSDIDEKIYSILEKPNSRLEEKFPYVESLSADNNSCFAIYSVDLILLNASQSFVNFLEEPFNKKEYCIGKKINEILNCLKESEFGNYLEKIIKTGECINVSELVYELTNKGVTYWDALIIPIYEDKKVKYLIHNTTEVTERVSNRKYIEEQNKIIEQQKEQLEAIIENMMDGLYILDKNGQFINMNSEARKVYQQVYSKEQGDTNEITQYLDTNGNPISISEMSAFRILEGKDYRDRERIVVTRSDKHKIVDVITSPIYDKDGAISLVVVCSRDITDLIQSQSEVYNQKELLETFIENIPDPFFIYDKEGNLIKMNAAGRRLYPQLDDVKTIRAKHNAFEYFDLAGNPIHHKDLPASRAARGEKVKNAIVVIRRGKKDQITEADATPIFDKDNNLIYFVLFHRDITETFQNQLLIKNQQDKMLKTEKEKNEALKKAIEMKDEFLSLISHEFKTPLTVINSAIQAMELICKNELSDKAKGFLNKIRQNSNRQLKLVNNLLDITRLNAGHLKINKKNLNIVLLVKSITESITVFAEQKGIKLSFSSTLGEKVIGIDEEKFERILLNLLSNAVKFTPEGKAIFVKVSQKILKGKCKVCIQVIDKGVGIPNDMKEFIFEKFGQVDNSFTRQAEGTGIGLHLVKMLVELLGGEITLESKEGIGSIFTILLPITKVIETPIERMIMEINDNRLIQATAIEFSDIYLK